ncbi:MAG: hypothetical protein R6V03_07535 [Kiritimatiellia bacterium]
MNSNKFWTPSLISAAIFAALYMCSAAVAAVVTGNGEFLFYIASMAVIIAGIGWAHAGIHFSGLAVWCLALWGLMHMAGGLVPVPESWNIDGHIRVLYSWWLVPGFLKYDNVVHVFGFGATTLACWQGIRAVAGPRRVRPTFGVLLLAAAAAQGFGAINEIIEFAATLSLPETNVGGYVNTGWDLVSNLSGSVIAAVLIRVFSKAERNGTVKSSMVSAD